MTLRDDAVGMASWSSASAALGRVRLRVLEQEGLAAVGAPASPAGVLDVRGSRSSGAPQVGAGVEGTGGHRPSARPVDRAVELGGGRSVRKSLARRRPPLLLRRSVSESMVLERERSFAARPAAPAGALS